MPAASIESILRSPLLHPPAMFFFGDERTEGESCVYYRGKSPFLRQSALDVTAAAAGRHHRLTRLAVRRRWKIMSFGPDGGQTIMRITELSVIINWCVCVRPKRLARRFFPAPKAR